jgi:hypothetical protein
MDLKALHSLMSRKKFHYFEGKTNDRENNLYLTFSKLHGGRGDGVEIRIGDTDNDINCWINSTNIEMKNVGDNEIFSLIETRC